MKLHNGSNEFKLNFYSRNDLEHSTTPKLYIKPVAMKFSSSTKFKVEENSDQSYGTDSKRHLPVLSLCMDNKKTLKSDINTYDPVHKKLK